jgi:hypothetical protein
MSNGHVDSGANVCRVFDTQSCTENHKIEIALATIATIGEIHASQPANEAAAKAPPAIRFEVSMELWWWSRGGSFIMLNIYILNTVKLLGIKPARYDSDPAGDRVISGVAQHFNKKVVWF